MRSHDGRPRRRAGADALGVRLGGVGPRGRRAPALSRPAARDRGGQRVAVELELTAKAAGRRERILAGYAADAGSTPCCTWSTTPAVGAGDRADRPRALGIADLRPRPAGRASAPGCRRVARGAAGASRRAARAPRRAASTGAGARAMTPAAPRPAPPYWLLAAFAVLLVLPLSWATGGAASRPRSRDRGRPRSAGAGGAGARGARRERAGAGAAVVLGSRRARRDRSR